MDDVLIVTNPCIVCGGRTQLVVNEASFDAWRSGTLIQDAFPDMAPEARELLMTGTHPACWEEMFGEGNE